MFQKLRDLPLSRFALMMQEKGEHRNIQTAEYYCPKHGNFTCSTYEHDDGTRSEASCWECDRIRIDQELAESRARNIMAIKAVAVGLPENLRSVRIIDLTPKEQAGRGAIAYLDGIDKEYRNAIFFGKTGTGKSWIAAAYVNRFAAMRKKVQYYTEEKLMGLFKDCFDKASDRTEKQIVQDLESLDLLVLDEVGIKDKTEWKRGILQTIIDLRTSRRKPTIIISNNEIEALKEYLGDPAVSRLMESGKAFQFCGNDRRREKN
jgi:DNA replication protein DnaC